MTYKYEWGEDPQNVQLYIQGINYTGGQSNIQARQILVDPENYSGSPTTIVTGVGRSNDTIEISGYLSQSAVNSLMNDYRLHYRKRIKLDTVSYYGIITNLNYSYKLEDGNANRYVWFNATILIN